MAIDPDRWWRLLVTLLDEHDEDVMGERLAVLDFAHIHHRITSNGERP